METLYIFITAALIVSILANAALSWALMAVIDVSRTYYDYTEKTVDIVDRVVDDEDLKKEMKESIQKDYTILYPRGKKDE